MILLANTYWEVKETKDRGRGLFAKKEIRGGTVVGDYLGTVLKTAEFDTTRDLENLYLMYYHDYASIYPNLKNVGIHLVNHSCMPNCQMYTYRGHTLFFSLRRIFAGEELTISYMFSPKDELCDPCTHICNCQSISCTKTMHLTLEKYKKWRSFQDACAKADKREKISYGSELQKLSSYPKTIADNPIYDLFANTEVSAKRYRGKIFPKTGEIRKLIKKFGRMIDFPEQNLRITGVVNNIVISKSF